MSRANLTKAEIEVMFDGCAELADEIVRLAQGDVRSMLVLAESVSGFEDREIGLEFLRNVREEVGLKGSAIAEFYSAVGNVPDFTYLIVANTRRTVTLAQWAMQKTGQVSDENAVRSN